MTKDAPSAAKIAQSRSAGIGGVFLVSLWRLLLLGVGAALAALLGLVVANFYRSQNPDPPLLAKVLGYTPLQTAASPSLNPPSAVDPSPQLSATTKKQLTTQLTQLETELDQLNQRTTTLEAKLGSRRPNEPLEKRLQIISQQLQGKGNRSAEVSQAAFSSDNLKMTLPSDVLFTEGSILRPEASLILDKVITDLQNYQGATIRIAAHTDDKNDPKYSRSLSFQRARAVEQYLTRALGDQYRWVAVGYGESNFLVDNDSDFNRQRNRRIEISISN